MRKWTAFLPRCVSGIYANPLLQGSTSLHAPLQLVLPPLRESYFKSTLSAVAPIRCSPRPSNFYQQDLSKITTFSFLLQPNAVFNSVCFVLWEASQEFSDTFVESQWTQRIFTRFLPLSAATAWLTTLQKCLRCFGSKSFLCFFPARKKPAAITYRLVRCECWATKRQAGSYRHRAQKVSTTSALAARPSEALGQLWSTSPLHRGSSSVQGSLRALRVFSPFAKHCVMERGFTQYEPYRTCSAQCTARPVSWRTEQQTVRQREQVTVTTDLITIRMKEPDVLHWSMMILIPAK